jgi:hypothetical protein
MALLDGGITDIPAGDVAQVWKIRFKFPLQEYQQHE